MELTIKEKRRIFCVVFLKRVALGATLRHFLSIDIYGKDKQKNYDC